MIQTRSYTTEAQKRRHISSSESEQDDRKSRKTKKITQKPGSKNKKIKIVKSNKNNKNHKSNKQEAKSRKPRVTKKQVKENPVVGIDLGTSFSSIAFHDGTYTTTFGDPYDSRLISSVVYFDPNNGQAFVGEEAERKSDDCLSNLIIDSKRFMGVMYHNDFVNQYRQKPSNMMEIIEDENGMAAFSVEINGEKVVKKPEEIAAEILRYLIGMAEDYFGTQVKRAVISVPAGFSNSQRAATKKAADLVGLELIKLITEPTAGAVCYLKNQMRKSNVMVFDWGGGTLDLSFIEVINDTFEVKAVDGDLFLGGRDVDEKLYGHFKSRMGDINNRAKRQMMNVLCRMKKRLTIDEQVEDNSIGGDNGKNSLSRSEFDKILNGIYQKIKYIIRFSLEESGWSSSKVDQVVIIGGSSRIPMIKKIIVGIFGEGKIKTDLNPSEAVARGAAIQGYELAYRDQYRENFSATEVTPRSLGVSIATDLFVVIIEKNTSIPVTKSKEFVTWKNGQTSLLISIYEGERKNCAFNNKLGELEIKNITPKRAGDVKVNIDFNLNEDGILNITASESSCGVTKSLAVTMGHFRFRDLAISYTRSEVERRNIDDRVFENFNIRRNEINTKIEHVLYDIDRISNQSDKDKVERICHDFQYFAQTLRFTEIELLEDGYQELLGELSIILRDTNI